ncbi:MAG: hypothetical protein EPO13_04430 [Actinomycetota bacterium]|nr:MAG: hypothetical protein EPO13_04430 [Actinomycetota bacterium]
MTDPTGVTADRQLPVERLPHANYAGAIYGSLLAAATILGTAATEGDDPSSQRLVATLIVTSLVFWLLHVYVRIIGDELPTGRPLRQAVRRAAAYEYPILAAAALPSLAVAAGLLLDETGRWAAWLGFLVALGAQVVATWIALRLAGGRLPATVVGMGLSILLGLVLIWLKVLISH